MRNNDLFNRPTCWTFGSRFSGCLMITFGVGVLKRIRRNISYARFWLSSPVSRVGRPRLVNHHSSTIQLQTLRNSDRTRVNCVTVLWLLMPVSVVLRVETRPQNVENFVIRTSVEKSFVSRGSFQHFSLLRGQQTSS